MDRKDKIMMIAALSVVILMWLVMAAGVVKFGF